MEIDFEELMSKKSESELEDYINNVGRYTPEAIAAAIKELKNRGRSLSNEEMATVENGLKAIIALNEKESTKKNSNSWSKNIVSDPNAPLFYSQRAIWGFSVIFTVIFGAVLLSSNLHERKPKWIVIGFGAAYTTLAILLLNLLPRTTGLTFGVNAGGAILLTNLFWDKYIGKNIQFRAKPIWKPLIISILISIPFLLAIIYG